MADHAFEPFQLLRSRAVVLPQDDIDTDQILPARFMTTTSREGLGKVLFHDWRFEANEPTDHVLNQVDLSAHRILIAGRNFGSGSSREHAVWALTDAGFRAVIAPGLADIFSNNAVQNGLLPLPVSDAVHLALSALTDVEIIIDLEQERLSAPEAGVDHIFHIEPFARTCLLNGQDALGWLLGQTAMIKDFERNASDDL